MNRKTTGTHGRPPGIGTRPLHAETGTQVYPLPQGPSPSGARAPEPAGARPDRSGPAVSVLPIVGIEGARSALRATATRAVNEPTRIFVVTPPPPAPLLRAFDDGRPRANTWSTAQTISAPMAEVVAEQASAKAPVVRSEPADVPSKDVPSKDAARENAASENAASEPTKPKPRTAKPRSLSRDQLLERLRQSSGASKKLLAFAVASAVVVSLGTLVGGNLAKGVVPARTSKPAVATSATTQVEANAAVPAPATPPEPEPPSSTPAEVTSAEPTSERAPTITITDPEPSRSEPSPAEPSRDRPSAAPDGKTSHEVTLARQAVDALLAGDRPKALQHYRELSRKAPDRDAYREAVRLLSAATASPQLVRSP
jgi:hypothetical protein